MTDDEVLDEARAEAFELVERMSAGQWSVGWARGGDDRWPCIRTCMTLGIGFAPRSSAP